MKKRKKIFKKGQVKLLEVEGMSDVLAHPEYCPFYTMKKKPRKAKRKV